MIQTLYRGWGGFCFAIWLRYRLRHGHSAPRYSAWGCDTCGRVRHDERAWPWCWVCRNIACDTVSQACDTIAYACDTTERGATTQPSQACDTAGPSLRHCWAWPATLPGLACDSTGPGLRHGVVCTQAGPGCAPDAPNSVLDAVHCF